MNSIRDRIRAVSQQAFVDPTTGKTFRFTWRTIETWRCRYQKHGITTLEQKTRCDKNTLRKVQLPELAEAINEVLICQ
jgi:putative transposase